MKVFLLSLFGVALGNRVQVQATLEGALEEQEEVEYAYTDFENETEGALLDSEANETLTELDFLELEEVVDSEAASEEDWFGKKSQLGPGACVKTKMAVAVGGYKHTYVNPASENGEEITDKCYFGPFNNGEVSMKCTNGKWSFSNVRCGRTPGERWAGQGTARRAAPKRATPAKKNSKDKCYALCVRPGSVGKCGRCTHSQQCAGDYFCCPHMKLCILQGGGLDNCDLDSAAHCNGCGSAAESPESRACKCGNKAFPKKWLDKNCDC